jgi:3,4-dihydroxy 2-butanone 4-phosphate synthase/GTP cyclohydrolase II
MVALPDDAAAPRLAVSVDLHSGITTGISARDRAATVQALADPATLPGDLVRPGHVLPLRAHPGGVLESPHPAEALLELCAAAGVRPAAAYAEIVDDGGDVPGPAELASFAAANGLALVRISEVVAWRRRRDRELSAGLRAEWGTGQESAAAGAV